MATKRGNNEGSVYRRKDRRWVAAITVWKDGKRRRKTAIAASKRGANARLAELQRGAEQGLSLDADSTLAAHLAKWLDSVRSSLRPRTFAGYEQIVRGGLAPRLGRISLRKLTPGDVDEYLRSMLASGRTPQTCKNHHAVLRRALGQAMSWDLIDRNVAKLVTPPRVPHHNVRPLTPEQAHRFLVAVEGDRLSALYAVTLSLGLRQCEALGLTWDATSFEDRTLEVRHTLQRYGGEFHLDEPKTHPSRRTISLPEPLIEALRRHRDRQEFERHQAGELWAGERWGLVFSNEIGEPLDGSAVTRGFQRKLAELDLPRQRFHDMRHAAGSFLIAQGVPLRVVMEILGHSTIATTANVYGHVLPELVRDATDRTAAVLFGTS